MKLAGEWHVAPRTKITILIRLTVTVSKPIWSRPTALYSARCRLVMVGLKAPVVRQLRHAEQVDLVRHDQGGPRPVRPHMHADERTGFLPGKRAR
jgi:hypothetical protein